jgi:undecaprenyl-phosphate 4-deoxy-4-formamido-L-arabinose transferase
MAADQPNRVGEGSRERVEVSVIVPIWNEAPTLDELCERLCATMQRLRKSYEVIFVDDGSTDESASILKELYAQYAAVKVIRFNRNYGQHIAVFAGLERARGEIVVTLDGDLQNPPEEIPKLLEKIQEGYDVVGGQRLSRQDPLGRRLPSWLISRLASQVVGVDMRDYGSMLRAYRRSVVEQLLHCRDRTLYIPALANAFAASAAEVPVAHQRRASGRSKYNFFSLVRLSLDLLTGFSLLPMRLIGCTGAALTVLGLGLGLYFGWQTWRGALGELTPWLVAVILFVAGLQLLALGWLGEYVGRTAMEVRRRPRYGIQDIWE